MSYQNEITLLTLLCIIAYISFLYFKLKKETNKHKDIINNLKDQLEKLSSENKKTLAENKILGKRVEEGIAAFTQAYNEINKIFAQMDRSTNQLNESVKLTYTDLQESQKDSKELFELSQVLNLEAKEIEKSTEYLNNLKSNFSGLIECSNQTKKKIDNIELVTKEAKLLSFNAKIEAVRAGVHGKGFSAVSDKIEQFSKESFKATLAITNSINFSADKISSLGLDIENTTNEINKINRILTEKLVEVENKIVHVSGLNQSLDKQINESTKHLENFTKTSSLGLESLLFQLTEGVSKVSGVTIENLSPKDVYPQLSRFKLIDVRREAEYIGELGHVKGTVLMVLQDNLEEKLEQVKDKDSDYLFICKSGGRSAKAAKIALAQGFKNVYNLEGGMLKWNENKLPIELSAA